MVRSNRVSLPRRLADRNFVAKISGLGVSASSVIGKEKHGTMQCCLPPQGGKAREGMSGPARLPLLSAVFIPLYGHSAAAGVGNHTLSPLSLAAIKALTRKSHSRLPFHATQ